MTYENCTIAMTTLIGPILLTGKAHFKSLMRSKAIENQSYVIAAG